MRLNYHQHFSLSHLQTDKSNDLPLAGQEVRNFGECHEVRNYIDFWDAGGWNFWSQNLSTQSSNVGQITKKFLFRKCNHIFGYVVISDIGHPAASGPKR